MRPPLLVSHFLELFWPSALGFVTAASIRVRDKANVETFRDYWTAALTLVPFRLSGGRKHGANSAIFCAIFLGNHGNLLSQNHHPHVIRSCGMKE